MIPALQISIIVLWFVVVVVTTPATYRSLMGKGNTRDEMPAALFFVGLIFVGGVWLRYMDIHRDDVWAAVYGTIAGVALYSLILMHQRNGR